jgi:hypothetical protein
MPAWTMPAPRTPGHDALMRTLIGATPAKVASFDLRVRYAVRQLNENAARTDTKTSTP